MASAVAAPIHTTVVGVFDDRASARDAIDNLRRAGFSDHQLGFIARDTIVQTQDIEERQDERADIGAAIGAAAGGAAGLAIATMVLTPIGPIVAGGALIAWLATATAGVATGAVVGALIGLGISEADAQRYENELQSGRVLVTVHDADQRADDARSVVRHHGGIIKEPGDIGGYGTGLPATPY